MKKTWALLVVLAVVNILSCSREPLVVDTFLEYDLMTEEEHEEFLEDFSEEILNEAYAISFWLTVRRDLRSTLRGRQKPTGKEAERLIQQAKRRASGLLLLGLVTEEEFPLLQRDIDSLEVFTRQDLLGWEYDYRHREELVGEDAMVSLSFAWKEAGLLTEASQLELDSIIEESPTLAALSLPRFLPYAVSFPVDGLDIRETDQVKSIFNSLLFLVPEANMTQFSYRIDTVHFPERTPPNYLEFHMTAVLNGKPYQSVSPAEILLNDELSNDPPEALFPHQRDRLPEILNQFLRQQGIEDRIVALRPVKSFPRYPEGRQWFTRLNEFQAVNLFSSFNNPWSVFPNPFDN